jgi:glycerophosphoryl diester phosphodiesterase
MKTFAHRGYNAKDNTLEAFQNAIGEKFDYLEADVHRTADYDLVLHHAPIIGTHYIEKTTVDILTETYPDLLTLDAFFLHFPPTVYKAYLDLKGGDSVSTLVMNYLNQKRITLRNIIVASFNRYHLNTFIHNKIPVKLGFITANTYLPHELDTMMYGIDFIVVEWASLSNRLIEIVLQHNKKIIVYTCKTIPEYQYIKRFNHGSTNTLYGIVSDIIIPDENNINPTTLN